VIDNFRSSVLPSDIDDVVHLKVRRRHLLQDALYYFKSYSLTKKRLRITFVGEPGVDAGGPLKEFFYLLLQEISRNKSLFHGSETSLFPVHNMFELSQNTFYYVGCIFAASIIHVGVGPHFFANSVADYLLFGSLTPCIEDVFDSLIKEKLLKLSQTTDLAEFCTLLDSKDFEFRFDCGVSIPISRVTSDNLEVIVNSLCLHYTLIKIKAELDQIVKGLEAFQLHNLVNRAPLALKKAFLHEEYRLTADDIFDLFSAQFSPNGSNKRETEEECIMNWIKYTQEIENNHGVIEVNDSKFTLSLEMIVFFATALPSSTTNWRVQSKAINLFS
jgi:hypothetical protein